MPFVRFSRDKRGYEYVYLVEASTRNRQAPPRVLYWYRTPPGVRVGREPFDADVRRALEERYRDVTFDWKAITSAQPPNPQIETWRERRRAKRDARRLQQGGPPPAATPGAELRPESAAAEPVDEELADQPDPEALEMVSGEADMSGADAVADVAAGNETDDEGDAGGSDGEDGE